MLFAVLQLKVAQIVWPLWQNIETMSRTIAWQHYELRDLFLYDRNIILDLLILYCFIADYYKPEHYQ